MKSEDIITQQKRGVFPSFIKDNYFLIDRKKAHIKLRNAITIRKNLMIELLK